MSKGSGSNTTTQKADPWAGQQPYLLDLYAKAQGLPTQQFFPGQTYATPSDLTYTAEQLAEQAALGPQTSIAGSILPSLEEQLMSPAQRFSDPLLQESLRAALSPMEESASRLLQQTRRDSIGAGQLGGTRQGILESEVIKDLLTKQSDVASKLYGDVYGDTLTAQGRALGLAPQAMSTIMQPSSTLANIASAQTARAQQPITEAMQRFAFEQEAPGRALSQYANIAGGTIIPGTQTTTGPGTSGPGVVAGALGGAGLGSLLAGPNAGFMNPYILGGALLGGLFS
jgi:hypothetical protein